MLRKSSILIIFLTATRLFSYGQEKITITPALPERGQEITITYDPSAAGALIPPSSERLDLVFTYSNFYELPTRISMEKIGSVWQTKFPLARYATYATFYVQSDTLRDQPAPDKHFAIAVYDKEKRVSSGYLYEGYSLPAQLGRVPDLKKKQAALYQQELENNPSNYEAKLVLLAYKIAIANGGEKEKLTKEAEVIIAAKFYENPGNMGLMNLTTMGYLIIGQNTRLDSIRQIVKTKYPTSEAGYELRITDIAAEEDKAKMEKALVSLLRSENSKNKAFLKEAHELLLDYYISKKQTAKALAQLRLVGEDHSPYRAKTLKNRAELFYKGGIALDTALSLAQQALAIADTYPAGLIRYFPATGHIPSFVDKDTRAATTNKARGNLLSLIALIKLQQGKESASYLSNALKISSDNETLANAGEYYRKRGANKEAFEAYKQIMYQLPEDTTSFRKMEESYMAWNKTKEGLDAHVDALKEHWRVEMRTQLKKEILRIPSPDFAAALVDLNGQAVRKEALKNKIIVLDFWATWCVPCMHEMPYLQNAYESYRSDTNVVFMVINSGSKNTLQDAQGWWGNKRFSFPVYYNNDPMIGDKLKFNVIPATYIIDTAGDIRFKTIGFEGAVVERKIKAAIALLKEGE